MFFSYHNCGYHLSTSALMINSLFTLSKCLKRIFFGQLKLWKLSNLSQLLIYQALFFIFSKESKFKNLLTSWLQVPLLILSNYIYYLELNSWKKEKKYGGLNGTIAVTCLCDPVTHLQIWVMPIRELCCSWTKFFPFLMEQCPWLIHSPHTPIIIETYDLIISILLLVWNYLIS